MQLLTIHPHPIILTLLDNTPAIDRDSKSDLLHATRLQEARAVEAVYLR